MFFSNLDTIFYSLSSSPKFPFRCLYTNIYLLLQFFRTKNINSVKI